jgi:transcriptional regulator with XRE-family HTH domain
LKPANGQTKWLAKRHEEIAGELRAARLRAGMTQAAVAKEVGVTAAFISMVESGRAWPSVKGFLLIAKALDVRPETLL